MWEKEKKDNEEIEIDDKEMGRVEWMERVEWMGRGREGAENAHTNGK